MEPSRAHATIFVDPSVSGPIESLRARWDPAMAGQIAAHTTLVYPEEVPDYEALAGRVALAAATTAPFRLLITSPFFLRTPDAGVFVHVEDPTGGFRAMRRHITSPPFTAVDFPPHVTVVHPRTSVRGMQAWESIGDLRWDIEFVATEVAITLFTGEGWEIAGRFPLTG